MAEFWSGCDRIFIEDLLLRCVVGLYDWERKTPQDVVFNIVLGVDLRRAGQTDDLSDTVDYKAIKKSVIAMVEVSSFQLVESLAERISAICLAQAGVKKVQVRVDKPGALRFARSVGVEIRRERSSEGGG
jgi:D-erythro-7,8-dihydroneopterin triphosphate epimerase